ncbi:AAA family ATPase, partial [Micromonospora sp. NPDC049230]|uniref:AAA family ATPase n=1 Tax=Micromonospora sp. NPDC049230 TaxID=3155502 RepID=UPI0033CF417B
SRRLLTVVDATNTRWAYRDPLISRARRFDVPVLAVVMATPLEVCQERNADRDGVFAPYPGANAAPIPPTRVSVLHYETRKEPPHLREVDAVLTIDAAGAAAEWHGADRLPVEVLAAPWLADTLDAPARPRFVPDRIGYAL